MAETTQGGADRSPSPETLSSRLRLVSDAIDFSAYSTAAQRREWSSVAREAAAALSQVEASREAQGWQPIATAPVGSWPNGPKDTRDPAYAEPPKLWLALEDGLQCVGYFDAYYAEGGNGYDGRPAWVEQFSSERIRPTHWMPKLPSPPETAHD